MALAASKPYFRHIAASACLLGNADAVCNNKIAQKCFRFISSMLLIKQKAQGHVVEGLQPPPLLSAHHQFQVLFYKRTFLTDKNMKLDEFEESIAKTRKRFSDGGVEFKSHFVRQLEDPDTELAEHEIFSYIQLLDKRDPPNTSLRVVQRVLEQAQQEIVSCFSRTICHEIAVAAIKKCHVLQDPDMALKIFSLLAPVKIGDNTQFKVALAITMDLLYENRLYHECVKVAIDLIDEDYKTGLAWFYTLSFISAFHLNTAEHLMNAARIHDARKECRTGKGDLRETALLALYCVKQKRVDAALTLTGRLDNPLDSRTVNINILAYLAAGNVDDAICCVRDFQFHRDKTGDHHHILYRDVFRELWHSVKTTRTANRKLHFAYLKHLRKHYLTYIGPIELSEQLLKSFIGRLGSPPRKPSRVTRG